MVPFKDNFYFLSRNEKAFIVRAKSKFPNIWKYLDLFNSTWATKS